MSNSHESGGPPNQTELSPGLLSLLEGSEKSVEEVLLDPAPRPRPPKSYSIHLLPPPPYIAHPREPELVEEKPPYWFRFSEHQLQMRASRLGLYSPKEILQAGGHFLKQKMTWALLAGLAVCGLIYIALAARYWVSVIDDAYITFRFSDNLVRGYGLRFNPDGMRVEGFTNFTWMLLIAGALKAGMDAMFTAKLLGLLSGLATMLVTWRFAAALRGRDDPLNLLPAIFLGTNSTFAFWAVQGLETLLQVALVTAAYHFFYLETKDRRRWIISPLFATLAAMTRFDSLYYLSPLGLWGLWEVLRLRMPLRRMVFWAALAAVTFGGFFLWKVWYFGDLYPNTAYAKLGRDEIYYARGQAHLEQFYLNQAGWEDQLAPEPFDEIPENATDRGRRVAERVLYLLRGGRFNSLAWTNLWVISLLLCVLLPRPRILILIVLPILMQAYYVYHVGGDWMPCFRFFQIALPFLGLAMVAGLARWGEFVKGRLWAKIPAYVLGGLLLAVTAFEQFAIDTVYVFGPDPNWYPKRLEADSPWFTPHGMRRNFAKGFSPPLGPISDYLMLNTQPGAWILMSDVGQPMWFSPHLNLIDVDGLTDKYLADAPSVRDENFGGPELTSPEAIYSELLENHEGEIDPQTRRQLRAKAKAEYSNRLWERNERYIMEYREPEYIVAFVRHSRRGPDSPVSFVYPKAVNVAYHHEDFANYEDDFTTLKTGIDIWNHVYRRADVPKEIPPEVRIERLQQAIDRNPRMGYLRLLLFEEWMEQGKEIDDGMRRLLLETVDRFWGDESLCARVLARLAREQDWDTQQEAIEILIAKDPERPHYHRQLSQSYERQGEYEKAAEALENSLKYLPSTDNGPLYHLGYLYERRLDDPNRAIQAARRATERRPDDERAWSDYASISDRAERYEQALEGFQKLLELKGGEDQRVEQRLRMIKEKMAQEEGIDESELQEGAGAGGEDREPSAESP